MVEEWKDIKGYEGLYEISNYGNVKNKKGNILKPYDNKGYLRIGLSKNNKRKQYLLHVLVATHFISEKPFENAEVNHKDLNRKNNYINNLEWVTGEENVKHCIENMNGRKESLQKDMTTIGKLYCHLGIEASKKPVQQIDKHTGLIIAEYESAREASKKTNSNYKNISQVCNGEKKTHNGYIWRFADKEGATTIETTL